jgi:hypothetical protein
MAVDFDRGIATRIEDFARENLDDFEHGARIVHG